MYEGFAGVYDHMMDNIPYDEWFQKLKAYLAGHGITEGTICELGCGTGMMTERFANDGFQMIGIDQSEDMLAIAMEKKMESGSDILYLQQDMESFELAEPVDVILSVCDSMNYLVQDSDMSAAFGRIHTFLKPEGLLIFDLKTAYCYRDIMGNQTWVEQDDEVSYIWENYFYEESSINEYTLTIFRRRPDSELFEKIEEAHYQRAYDLKQITEMMQKNGLEVCEILDSSMRSEPTETSERVYIVARVAEKAQG